MPQAHLGVVDDRGEDVVELVRDRRGKCSHGAHFLRLQQLPAELVVLCPESLDFLFETLKVLRGHGCSFGRIRGRRLNPCPPATVVPWQTSRRRSNVSVFLDLLAAQTGRSCRFCYFFVSEWLNGRLKRTIGPNRIGPNASFGGSSFVAPDGSGVLENREAWWHFDAAIAAPRQFTPRSWRIVTRSDNVD